MGWFSRKQPKAADDALVERTLAFAQEVAKEKPEDEQALLAMIDGIKMMPPKPSSTIDAVEASAKIEMQAPQPIPLEAMMPERILPATLPPISLPSMSRPPVVPAKVADEPIHATESVNAGDTFVFNNAVAATNAQVPTETPAGSSLTKPAVPQPALSQPVPSQAVLRPPVAERARPVEQRRSSAPPQSEMRREIAQRVQNFKAHQQRLNDEREARIKKIYADMQARLEQSGASKSPPVS